MILVKFLCLEPLAHKPLDRSLMADLKMLTEAPWLITKCGQNSLAVTSFTLHKKSIC